MLKKVFISLILILMPILCAQAKECIVSTGDEFVDKVTDVANDGACSTDSADYRELYDDYRGTSINFHVVRFSASANFIASPPCLAGYNEEPLIIIVDSTASVNIENEICINQNVIIDNLGMKGVEIKSSSNSILNSKIHGGALKISGDENNIVETEVTRNSGDAVTISGNANHIIKSKIYNNAGMGVRITGADTLISESKISDNKEGGVYVETCTDEACADPHTALISKTQFYKMQFYKNGSLAIGIEKWPLVSPIDIVTIDALSTWKVTGNLGTNADEGYFWKNLNLKAIKIELFLETGEFVAETDKIDANTRQFVFSLPKPLTIGGRERDNPIFMATAVDYENGNTSPFSSIKILEDENDWDGDGLPNNQEDINQNGVTDFGETDPRKFDSDGDGLSDGEERLHTGKVGELMNESAVFADMAKLDPVNPDSDGDCLNDGMELGVTPAIATATSTMKSLISPSNPVTQSPSPPSSPYCKAILKKHNILEEVSGFDSDPETVTDPTNADSDNDGLNDGEEDWNFNGKRDAETNPNLPDSDGDTLLDGAEGDTNKNGNPDPNETDSLLADTDGDGLNDDVEILRLGSIPNNCDSDGDGLPDGVEKGIVNPNPANTACIGLQTAGTNYASVDVLSTLKVDSDGDGLRDGDEDANHNGWVDPFETDPTISDTDADGISDYVEWTLDADRDSSPDVDIALLKSGNKCSPPEDAKDIDCDAIPNARDDDSDNDSCSDKDEELKDDNKDGILDAWQMDVKTCGTTSSSVSSGSVPAPTVAAAPIVLTAKNAEPFSEGGSSCSLSQNKKSSVRFNTAWLILPLATFLLRRYYSHR